MIIPLDWELYESGFKGVIEKRFKEFVYNKII